MFSYIMIILWPKKCANFFRYTLLVYIVENGLANKDKREKNTCNEWTVVFILDE